MKPRHLHFLQFFCHWILITIALYLQQHNVTFRKFLHLLFHFGRVWRLQKNSLHHLTQNSFALWWMRLHLLLLNSSAFTNWPDGGNTTLDLIASMLLGHSGCSHWISPEVSTFSVLEFNIASVSASSFLNDLTFNDIPCVFTRDSRMIRADQI